MPIYIISIILICLCSGALAFFLLRASEPREPVPEPVSAEEEGLDYSWADRYPYVAHAFGGILGETYTNSREAFLLNYQLGHRVFEVDFAITDDGIPVLAHDAAGWRSLAGVSPDTPFTYENFCSFLCRGKYHSVSINDLLHLMQDYPDIYIVTDTKYFDKPNSDLVFQTIIDTARSIDEQLLTRFIPQIYREEMYDWIMAQYPWKSVIYTLYSDPYWTPESVLAFSERTGVKMITMWHYLPTKEITDLWYPAGIRIAAHTVNNAQKEPDGHPSSESALRGTLGIKNFYTDFLTP